MRLIRIFTLLLGIAVFNNAYGSECSTINASFSSSANNIMVGDQVSFSYDGFTGGFCCQWDWQYSIPSASTTTGSLNGTYAFNIEDLPGEVTAAWETPGSYEVNLTIDTTGYNCSPSDVENIDDLTFTETITVMASGSAIPTLSQWGILILGLAFLVFGLVKQRERKAATIA